MQPRARAAFEEIAEAENSFLTYRSSKKRFQGSIASDLLLLMTEKKWASLKPVLRQNIIHSILDYCPYDKKLTIKSNEADKEIEPQDLFVPINVTKILKAFTLGMNTFDKKNNENQAVFERLAQIILDHDPTHKNTYTFRQNAIYFTQTIIYLNKLNMPWDRIQNMNANVIGNLVKCISFLDKNLTIQILNACANYSFHGSPYEALHLELLEAFSRNIKQMTTNDLVDILNSFAHLGIKWQNLNANLHHEIMKNMNPQHLREMDNRNFCNLVWSIAVMDVPTTSLQSIKKDIMNKIEVVIQSEAKILKEKLPTNNDLVSEQKDLVHLIQLKQAALYYDFKLSDKTLNLLNQWLNKNKPSQKQSNLEKDVINVLNDVLREKPYITYTTEELLSFKPVDIYFDKAKLILEINGNFHYNTADELRPKDAFNQTLLEKEGYKIINLSEKHWNKLKEENPSGRENWLNEILTKNALVEMTNNQNQLHITPSQLEQNTKSNIEWITVSHGKRGKGKENVETKNPNVETINQNIETNLKKKIKKPKKKKLETRDEISTSSVTTPQSLFPKIQMHSNHKALYLALTTLIIGIFMLTYWMQSKSANEPHYQPKSFQ